MFHPIKLLAFTLLPIACPSTQAWVIPPQFGIFPASQGEEPDVVAVTYTSDWNDPAASSFENYRRLTTFHDGLMIRSDMVLVNSPPTDITKPQIRKYSVRSEMISTGSSLPISKIHSQEDFNILELNCRVEGAEIHSIGFGDITHNKITNEGVAATIYFRDGDNQLQRSVQPLYSDSAYRCDRGPNFCIGYLIKDWANQIRDDGPHGSPVFYTDSSNSKKIIGLLKNDNWLRSSGGYRGQPTTYHTHLQSIDSLEDFIVSTSGVSSTVAYEWVTASSDITPKGIFIAGTEGSTNFKLCSAEVQSEVYPGYIGQQLDDTDDTDYPRGCVVSDGQSTVSVVDDFSVLRGKPAYEWVSYSSTATGYFQLPAPSNRTVCRQSDSASQRIGWIKTSEQSTVCLIVGQDGAEASIDEFQVLAPVAEKSVCTSSSTAATDPTGRSEFVAASIWVNSTTTPTTSSSSSGFIQQGSVFFLAMSVGFATVLSTL